MIDEELEMLITLSIRRNWDDITCDYMENCSDKDIALFLNVPIDVVIKIRRATKGFTPAELGTEIQQKIADDLTVIERMLEPQEIVGWAEEARVHLRNMQGTLNHADQILTQIFRSARSGDQKALISLVNNQFAELKSCFSTNVENTVFVRALYRKRFCVVDAAVKHIDRYLSDISDFSFGISDVLDNPSVMREILEEASPLQLKAGYTSPFSTGQ